MYILRVSFVIFVVRLFLGITVHDVEASISEGGGG
jgi:hypothetical protein